MPHLSPMNWVMMLILTSLILLTTSSTMWWKQQQKIQLKSTNIPNTTKPKWSW